MDYQEIENPMIRDRFWYDFERFEPKVVGECAGCKEEILEDEEIYQLDSDTIIHQDPMCCRDYVAEMGVCKLAGE